MWKDETQTGFILATAIMSVIAVTGFIATIVFQMPIFSDVVGILSFLIIVIFLLFGGCLLARMPLVDEKRYNPDGTPLPSWRRALLGYRLVLASFILFLYGLLFTFVGVFLGF
ncbi:MAG: hypothetical protein ACFFFC_15100 [Candidatus Thorarchaeota archaeon]